jgi:hypothetical protein
MAADARARVAKTGHPGRFKRWWAAHFSGFTRKEAWGYGVWLFFGLIVAVPEIWAAKWKESAKWPTISATVGELEYWHPWVALIVVAVIVLSAYSALRYAPEKTGVLPEIENGEQRGGLVGDKALPNRSQKGLRLTASPTPLREFGVGFYFAIALAIIALGTAIAAAKTDVDDEFATGRTLYGLTALFWVALPSALAWPKNWGLEITFPTLFETMRSLERRLRIIALAVAGGLAILLIHHVLYPWPSTIPDIKDLHEQYKQQGPRHKEHPPTPTGA